MSHYLVLKDQSATSLVRDVFRVSVVSIGLGSHCMHVLGGTSVHTKDYVFSMLVSRTRVRNGDTRTRMETLEELQAQEMRTPAHKQRHYCYTKTYTIVA